MRRHGNGEINKDIDIIHVMSLFNKNSCEFIFYVLEWTILAFFVTISNSCCTMISDAQISLITKLPIYDAGLISSP